MQLSALLLAQQLPDLRAQMHERRLVHHVLDAAQAIPALGLAHCLDVDDLLDPSRPARHHHHAVGEVHGLLHRMRDEQHGARMTPRQAHQLLLHHHARLRIQRAEGFVHQQHLRVQHIGARNGDALLHAARELVRVGLLVAAKPHQLDVVSDASAPLLGRHALGDQAELDVVPDALPGKQRELLEHHGAVRAGLAHLALADLH